MKKTLLPLFATLLLLSSCVEEKTLLPAEDAAPLSETQMDQISGQDVSTVETNNQQYYMNTILTDSEEFAEFETFMRKFLSKRSETAAKTGDPVISDVTNRCSDDYYWSPIFSKYRAPDSYLIIEDLSNIDFQQACITFPDTRAGGYITDVITQYFDVSIQYHTVYLVPKNSMELQDHDEFYTTNYRVIKINGEYRIEWDGDIRGYQYIFESDLNLLMNRKRETYANRRRPGD